MGGKWCQVKMLKILFWASSDLFEIDDFENFCFGFLLTMTHFFHWRFLGGHLKKEEWVVLFRGGVHSWLFGCLVRHGQDTNLGNFALVYFEKGNF